MAALWIKNTLCMCMNLETSHSEPLQNGKFHITPVSLEDHISKWRHDV